MPDKESQSRPEGRSSDPHPDASNDPRDEENKLSKWRLPHDLIKKIMRRRSKRRERTPYYLTDLPEGTYKALDQLRAKFIEQHGRDYEDEDEQFPRTDWTAFWFVLKQYMKATNHHPAHIYAVEKTRKMITDRNFKQVPDGWTDEWQKAVKEYEKWGAELEGPIKE